MKKPEIIYVYDPLCGWCYGFSPVIKKIREEYNEKIDFNILSGGMVIGEREGMIGDFADYILSAIPRVEEYTGVVFGEGYKSKLRDKSLFQSSLKPSIATEVFKSFNLDQAISFASEIQQIHYTEGDDLQGDAVYSKIAGRYGIDEKEFQKRMESNEYRNKTLNAFSYIKGWEITGFPAVLMVKDEKYYLIAKGYLPYEDLKSTIEKVLVE
ncbi:MAG: DsbA family protein [Bacteroidota bacterium]|nr:DsbA family protein [Bacteroidota bacterium]